MSEFLQSLALTVCLVVSGCNTAGRIDSSSAEWNGTAAYYKKHAKVSPMPASEVAFFDSGPAIKSAMLDIVRQAKRYILVGTFLLTDGPESREVLDALAEKKSQGVKVYLIGDASSRFVPETAAFDYLKGLGVPCAEFNPFLAHRLILGPKLLERDHRKFWVVDGRILLLGGANLNDPSLAPPESEGNRDLMVRLDSTAAAREMTASFVDTWNECPGVQDLALSDFTSDSPSESDAVSFWLFDQASIGVKSESTDEMMNGLFASAHREVWLVQPYTFVNPHILGQIRDLHARGVEVNVILSNQVRAPRFRYASYYGIRELIKFGARVWIYESEISPLHYKCALIDDRLTYVGSANLNFRSFWLARELNVVLNDRDSLSAVRKVVDEVIAESRPVTLEESRRYRGPSYFAWWLLMQAGG